MVDERQSERLRRITLEAAEIAALVPRNLQEAAYNRAFEKLMGVGDSEEQDVSRPERTGSSAASRRNTSPRKKQVEGNDDPVNQLMSSLSRTDHPEIGKADRSLDRAMHLLRIVERDHGIDGLSASQLARVLTDKFRFRVSRQALSQALDAAGDYVDRVPTGRVTYYRLMAPGEKYLDAGGAAAPRSGDTTSRRRRNSGKGKTSAPNSTTKKQADATPGKATRRRGSRGPKSLVEELIAADFFKQPRTIGDIQEHLRHKKGSTLKASELSPVLVRLLRDGRLDRERNEGGQYEYTVPA